MFAPEAHRHGGPGAPLFRSPVFEEPLHRRGTYQKDNHVKTDTDHDRNDRIEAAILMAALASLCLLVAIAVSTSVSGLSSDSDRQATAPAPDPTRTEAGIVPAAPVPDRQAMR